MKNDNAIDRWRLRMKRSYLFKIAVMLFTGLVPDLAASSKIEVEIEDFAFVPQSVTMVEGDTIEWKNRDNVGHTSTSGESGIPNGLWDSGIIGNNQTFSRVFDSAGTFLYYCKPHPYMTGTIVVNPKPDTTDTLSAVIIEDNDIPLTLLSVEGGEIKLALSNSAPLDLAIYDVTGREVSVLARGNFARGQYSIPVKRLERGVYFVRLASGDYVVTRKIVQIS